MDFSQQLDACVTQANDALRRFIAPLPFQNTPLVEAMQYGALLGGKRLRPFLVYATGQMFGVSVATLDAPRGGGGVHSRLFADARRPAGDGRRRSASRPADLPY